MIPKDSTGHNHSTRAFRKELRKLMLGEARAPRGIEPKKLLNRRLGTSDWALVGR